MLIDEVLFGLLKQKEQIIRELSTIEEQIGVLHKAKEEIRAHRTPKRLNMQQMVEESVMAGVQRARPGSKVEDKLDKAVEYAVKLAEQHKFPHTDPNFWRPHLEHKLAEMMREDKPSIFEPGNPGPTTED